MTEHKYGLGEFGNGTGVYRPESTNTPSEAAIQGRAIKRIQKDYPDAFVTKIHGGTYQRAGLPDLYIALHGMSIWIEMKRPGADTTRLQRSTLQRLADAGLFCGTAESVETVLEIIKKVLTFR